jgi:hypothetical protein
LARSVIQTFPPDNPATIFIDAISYVAKHGVGCRIRTVDGTDHIFHNVSYEKMLNDLSLIESRSA